MRVETTQTPLPPIKNKDGNALTGTIPTEFVRLSRLEEVWLSKFLFPRFPRPSNVRVCERVCVCVFVRDP